MQVNENIDANGSTVPAWRTTGRVAMVIALAAIAVLAVWSPISAGVAQGEPITSGSELRALSLAGDSEHNARAKEADQLARDYGEWLGVAHRKAGATAEQQPLPAQF
ncbi:MAG: hypothetical protein JWQ72_1226 [Polaromonas sp.]|nr:hypothetical protein [Polaromonas sp.]